VKWNDWEYWDNMRMDRQTANELNENVKNFVKCVLRIPTLPARFLFWIEINTSKKCVYSLVWRMPM
jgi:hypothetical protein